MYLHAFNLSRVGLTPFTHEGNMADSRSGADSASATLEHLQAMRDHEIHFEGRIIEGQWGEYSDLFQEVRSIGEIRPAPFFAKYASDDEYIVNKHTMMLEVMNNASRCLENLDSEMGWREKVENKVFECFDSEVVW